ncbi:hypothetical protein FQR65_LT16607 [Abscondita terminalis]|nr:hypothetical protein FQR65_LT16607 [Abscondita terminalis]
MHTLEIKNLHVSIEETEILKGINLIIKTGEIHALMGPNGNGKSTLLMAVMGHPKYEITKGDILLDGKSILDSPVDERSKAGIFLAMQNPQTIPGVSNLEFFKYINNAHQETPQKYNEIFQKVKATANSLNFDLSMLKRSVNEGFSGGEKKKNEILQLNLLQPIFSLIDEIDSGLDVDAIEVVSKNLNNYISDKTGMIIVSHYDRFFKNVKPTNAHIIIAGKIVKSESKKQIMVLSEVGGDLKLNIKKNTELNLTILVLPSTKTNSKKFNFEINLEEYAKLDLNYANLANYSMDDNFLINLNGPNSGIEFYSATAVNKSDQKNTVINPIHFVRNTSSNITTYEVINNTAKGFIRCASDIRKGASQSEAHQELRLLILDEKAKADSDPVLLIDENDIVASHANAIGMLDQEQIFYLRSRGLSERESQELILNGYFQPIFDNLEDEKISLELKNNRNEIYFDNAATSLKLQSVIDAEVEYLSKVSANPHTTVFANGFKSTQMIKDCRQKVAEFINAKTPDEIIFTSGTTHSLNQIVFGLKNELNEKNNIVLTHVEHSRKMEKLNLLEPLMYGGGNNIDIKENNYIMAELPAKLEGGTPNISGIYGFKANNTPIKDDPESIVELQKSTTCSDEITIQLKANNDTVEFIKFNSIACSISTAAVDILADQIKNITFKKALIILENYFNMITGKDYDESIMDELIIFYQIYKQQNRINCALLGANGIKNIILKLQGGLK